MITESQARAVILLDADASELEVENDLLKKKILVRDSIIDAMTAVREVQTSIDSAQTEIIASKDERIDLGKKALRRNNRQAVWSAIKGAWKEITIGVSCAGLGYGLGYVSSR